MTSSLDMIRHMESRMADQPVVTHRINAHSPRTMCCDVDLADLAPSDKVSSRIESVTCRPGKWIA